jgi:arginine decarboxylase
MEPAIPLSEEVVCCSGSGSGTSELVSFDAALIDAGVGNANLVEVSSVVPERAEIRNDVSTLRLSERITPGGFYPAVLSRQWSTSPEERAYAAVAACRLDTGYGVNVEVAGSNEDIDAVEAECNDLLAGMADTRGAELVGEPWFECATTASTEPGEYACAVAQAVYL